MKTSLCDNRDDPSPEIDLSTLGETLDHILTFLELPGGEVEVTLINDQTIQVLNRDYRKINTPTNVLAFPHYNWMKPCVCTENIHGIDCDGSPGLLGEVLVSVDTVLRDADLAGIPLLSELVRITIHGVLHIVGFDHQTDHDFEIMNEYEIKALKIINLMNEVSK